MTYDARRRDAYRAGLATLTGLTAIGVVTATGWLAGLAAKDHAHTEQVRAAEQQRAAAAYDRKRVAWEQARAAATPRWRTVWRHHPHRTVVETQVVHVAAVGTGGTLRATTPAPVSSSGSTSGSASHTSSSAGSSSSHATHTTTQAAPPPPPPPPAPSSGS